MVLSMRQAPRSIIPGSTSVNNIRLIMGVEQRSLPTDFMYYKKINNFIDALI
jgi:hypothetical protein